MCSCLGGLFKFEGPPSYEKSLKNILSQHFLSEPQYDDLQIVLQGLNGDDSQIKPQKALQLLQQEINELSVYNNWVYSFKALYILDSCVEEGIQLSQIAHIQMRGLMSYNYDENYKDADVEEILENYIDLIRLKSDILNSPDPLIKLSKPHRKMRMETMMSFDNLVQEVDKMHSLLRQIMSFNKLLVDRIWKTKLIKNVSIRNLYYMLQLFRTYLHAISVLMVKKDINQDPKLEFLQTNVCLNHYSMIIEISVDIQDFIKQKKQLSDFPGFNHGKDKLEDLNEDHFKLINEEEIKKNLENQINYLESLNEIKIIEVTKPAVNIETHYSYDLQTIQERDSEFQGSSIIKSDTSNNLKYHSKNNLFGSQSSGSYNKNSQIHFSNSNVKKQTQTQGAHVYYENNKLYENTNNNKDQDQKFDEKIFNDYQNSYSQNNTNIEQNPIRDFSDIEKQQSIINLQKEQQQQIQEQKEQQQQILEQKESQQNNDIQEEKESQQQTQEEKESQQNNDIQEEKESQQQIQEEKQSNQNKDTQEGQKIETKITDKNQVNINIINEQSYQIKNLNQNQSENSSEPEIIVTKQQQQQQQNQKLHQSQQSSEPEIIPSTNQKNNNLLQTGGQSPQNSQQKSQQISQLNFSDSYKSQQSSKWEMINNINNNTNVNINSSCLNNNNNSNTSKEETLNKIQVYGSSETISRNPSSDETEQNQQKNKKQEIDALNKDFKKKKDTLEKIELQQQGQETQEKEEEEEQQQIQDKKEGQEEQEKEKQVEQNKKYDEEQTAQKLKQQQQEPQQVAEIEKSLETPEQLEKSIESPKQNENQELILQNKAYSEQTSLNEKVDEPEKKEEEEEKEKENEKSHKKTENTPDKQQQLQEERQLTQEIEEYPSVCEAEQNFNLTRRESKILQKQDSLQKFLQQQQIDDISSQNQNTPRQPTLEEQLKAAPVKKQLSFIKNDGTPESKSSKKSKNYKNKNQKQQQLKHSQSFQEPQQQQISSFNTNNANVSNNNIQKFRKQNSYIQKKSSDDSKSENDSISSENYSKQQQYKQKSSFREKKSINVDNIQINQDNNNNQKQFKKQPSYVQKKSSDDNKSESDMIKSENIQKQQSQKVSYKEKKSTNNNEDNNQINQEKQNTQEKPEDNVKPIVKSGSNNEEDVDEKKILEQKSFPKRNRKRKNNK